MDEIDQESISNTRILLARNTPVALVVGAAGFLGSHLVDNLLSKTLQVIGVDDLSLGPPAKRAGKKENLKDAIGNKNFHFVISPAEKIDLELERLDYILIASERKINLERVLDLFNKHKCRLLFVSSVELYDEDNISNDLRWLKAAEIKIARRAKENNLNARILRLGSIFGPRMNFESSDPISRLIQQALTGDLQKDTTSDFSSRTLYVEDAVDLAIKCIFAGATAQKIFDGVLPHPIKISEIKQVLLDPVWYENKNFKPSELPPWPTPNLEKAVKILNWHPKIKLIKDLKETLNYFKDNEIKISRVESEGWREEEKEEDEGGENVKQSELVKFKVEKPKQKFSSFYPKIFPLFILLLIIYALIWPGVELGWGVMTFRFQLSGAVKNLEKGEFEKSLSHIRQASLGISGVKSIFNSLEPLRKLGILGSQFELGDNLANLATLSSDSAENTILGIQALYLSLKAVTGDINESPKDFFAQAATYLALADEDLSKANALASDKSFEGTIPGILKGRVDSLKDKLATYSNLVRKARALSTLLPEVVAIDSSKSYLLLLQNNNELRPTGGFIGSIAKVSFEAGKLKKLEVNDVYTVDGQLALNIEPPKEIKEDLNQKFYFLRDSNWEPDFPTAARQAQWFFTKETGERVEGVLALDLSSMEDLLSVLGPMELPDYNEKISSDNLFERSITHAEADFFPGTQAKKSFLTSLTQGLLNKLFFLPNQNWPGIVASLGRSMEKKHMSAYLDNPKLFSYLVSQNWASLLPRPSSEETEKTLDFLTPVEANLGANKANYYLDRNYNLETSIGKDGEINHRLRIAYTNRSPSDTFPAGKYKNRMRIYLLAGAKLDKVLWGEKDITKDVTSFVDYGRSVYSFLLELAPKEQKTLVLDIKTPLKLKFKEGIATYKLDIIKQAGTLKDPLSWKISYPINYKFISPKTQKLGPQEQTIQTDLSKDRSFEVVFSK